MRERQGVRATAKSLLLLSGVSLVVGFVIGFFLLFLGIGNRDCVDLAQGMSFLEPYLWT